MTPEFVAFDLPDDAGGPLLRKWRVKQQGRALGVITWCHRWRHRYVFSPAFDVLLDAEALSGLADFCADRTREYHEERVREVA